MEELDRKKLRWSFRWLQVETIATSMAALVMPVINLVFSDIGLTQAQIGLSQAIFMGTALLLDVPTGWLADRFSRRAANMLGDAVAASGFLLYVYADSFAMVIMCEVLVGIGIALTNGADVALLKAHAEALGENYRKVSSRLNAIKPIVSIFAAIAGAWMGTQNIRWPMLAHALFFVAGVFISLKIKEIGVRRKTERHPLRDMYEITKYTMRGHRQLSWRVFAAAFSGNSTHTAVFLLAPVFLAASYDIPFLGYAWAAMWAGTTLGAMLAHRYGGRFSARGVIVLPAMVVVATYALLAISINPYSVWLYAVFGTAFGWNISLAGPLVQQEAPDDIQATVMSVSSMLRRLMYVPLVYIVNYFGGIDLRYAMVISAVIYGLFTVVLAFGLSEKRMNVTP